MIDAFFRLAAKLERLLHKNLCRRVGDHLAAIREPATAGDLSAALDVPLHAVRKALRDMEGAGKVRVVQIRIPEGRAYRPVEIGLCEWCGLLDHHLVAGECPACAATVPDAARPAHARSVC